MFDQKWNILFSFFKQWQLYFDDVQAVEEVFPKHLFTDLFFQICVSSGNDSDVDPDCFCPP